MAKYKWEFYKDAGGKHRWRKTSTVNGEIVGASSQGFSSRQNSVNNAKLNGYKG
tara:strand:- start:287 stop:448 length:162 start_codon:yes stop_codon:yes gene_type:complete